MRSRFSPVVILFAFGLIAAACSSDSDVATGSADAPANPAAAEAAPALAIFDESSIAARKGEPLVINFFASWCPSCVAEMPDFEVAHQQFADDVTFIGVAMQDRESDALDLVKKTGVTYELGNDPDGSLFQSFNALAMPTTVFVSADGEVVRSFSGVLTAESLADIINGELL
ncbi:MAG: TlpA disulfide reductase family protein [Acidimicrobiales bacterium]